jgi:hypothetical protein
MLNRQAQPDGDLACSYARLASWQGEVSSNRAVERQAALLVTLHGRRQALDEARMRASSARAYSSLLSADFWDRVSATLERTFS